MSVNHSNDYLVGLVLELSKLPYETEWVEFKKNNDEPQKIGENISALANSAALEGKDYAYIVWGIRDNDQAVVGTVFDPRRARVGNEELENWLLHLLKPKIEFRFFTVMVDTCRVVLLEIARAAPLVDTQRFLDSPPKSRNEALASLMRRFGICEERGSGIDKVVSEIEIYQLPAPLFETPEGFTRAILFSHKPLAKMDKADRLRACYLHACLKRVMQDCLTKCSLRTRFGVREGNKATVSRYIREAVDSGLIKPVDEHSARKLRKYLPFWA